MITHSLTQPYVSLTHSDPKMGEITTLVHSARVCRMLWATRSMHGPRRNQRRHAVASLRDLITSHVPRRALHQDSAGKKNCPIPVPAVLRQESRRGTVLTRLQHIPAMGCENRFPIWYSWCSGRHVSPPTSHPFHTSLRASQSTHTCTSSTE